MNTILELTTALIIGFLLTMVIGNHIFIKRIHDRNKEQDKKLDYLHKRDSLYHEHLSTCAFISKDRIEYTAYGVRIKPSYPFITK